MSLLLPEVSGSMAASLGILTGPQRGATMTALGPKFLIGSGPQCHLRLTDSALQPVHAVLLLDGFTIRLRDMLGGRGVKVNGQPIVRDQRLNSGDTFEVASTRLQIENITAGENEKAREG